TGGRVEVVTACRQHGRIQGSANVLCLRKASALQLVAFSNRFVSTRQSRLFRRRTHSSSEGRGRGWQFAISYSPRRPQTPESLGLNAICSHRFGRAEITGIRSESTKSGG